MIDWIPIVLLMFKLIVFGTGMFFAIKWHYDKEKMETGAKLRPRALLLAGGKAVAVFVLLLLGLLFVTFLLAKKLGLELSY
ncbi:hypothetical protein QN374_11700 [Herbaspirillum sp. RTI4]|nr:hypothetical protein [Herbaspirillum sp. RTI4]